MHYLYLKIEYLMKRILFLIFLNTVLLSYGAKKSMPLLANWEFTQAGKEEWREAVVPGTVHQDLLRANLLPDPYYGLNEKEIQWVENEDWTYRTSFTLSADDLRHDELRLVFEGIDTYADIYLNGALILQSDNMFVGHSVPVTRLLKEGENRLVAHFHSPIATAMPQWESCGFNYPADNDHAERRTSVFTRKAPYSYGWDWGIRMATSGIWRPVRLEAFDRAAIEDFHVEQSALSEAQASLVHHLEVTNVLADTVTVQVRIDYNCEGQNGFVTATKTLAPDLNRIDIPMTISQPKRWMPNGWGKPYLYDITATVSQRDGTLLDSTTHRIGLRTVRVVNEKDAHGESFFLEVNGIPMFAKGANYIPQDAMLPAVTTERYRRLFRDIREANMNMIRIWGGGVYEDDRFYDLADENGILIWQDFMFACTAYPADPQFLRRVQAEADYNIRRLRNHACLALWCGNNEILEGLKYWGWQKKYTPEVYQRFLDDYDTLFRGLLPAAVERLDSGRFYVHTSPYFANWGRPKSWGTGDSHNWGIWYGRKPFESVDTDSCRFMSEFGFQSFPEMKTIASFASPADYAIESEVMNSHQKSSIGNHLIRSYMERYYHVPDSFADFVYVGLVMQGEGIARGLRAHRRMRPYCMGTLYWQLNDSWPVVSWSGIDYYGNWKALHYAARRSFAPVALDALEEGGRLNVYLLSDSLAPLDNLRLDMEVRDFNGRRLSRRSVSVSAPANSSTLVFSDDTTAVIGKGHRSDCVLLLSLKDRKGREIARRLHYFLPVKDLNLPETDIKYTIRTTDGQCRLTLRSPRLAKDVFIQIPIQGARFSDNFFDLLPGEEKTVVITSPELKKGQTPEIEIKHIRETY